MFSFFSFEENYVSMAEIITIAAIVVFVGYMFYSLKLFKKD